MALFDSTPNGRNDITITPGMRKLWIAICM